MAFIITFIVYTILLFFISWITARKAAGNSYFGGDRKTPWFVVAYGMIGSSISGVSFISVPGNVWMQNFFYLPLVFGFVAGYVIIAKVLLPLYYRMGLTSIYSYLEDRFGKTSHKTGTTVFMISRILCTAVRIYVVVVVLNTFIPDSFVHALTPLGTVVLISSVFMTLLYLYTYKGGVKTLIWTDVFQTTVMLGAIVLSIILICKDMGWNFAMMADSVRTATNANEGAVGYGKPFTSIFDWDWSHGTNSIKQFISGIFVTIGMTGLDQSMMQKNLSCKNIKEAQKNMYTTSIIIVVVNVFFVLLGALLCVYASHLGGFDAIGITKTDELFPVIAGKYLGTGVGVLFLIGLVSASYPSAGAALTSLTSSFCIDFLKLDGSAPTSKTRKTVQAVTALIFVVIIIVLHAVSSDAVINLIYKLASYTYGPLLGMFFFGILTDRSVRDSLVPAIAVSAPLICLAANLILRNFLGFDLGFSLLIVNSLLTYAGMAAISKR